MWNVVILNYKPIFSDAFPLTEKFSSKYHGRKTITQRSLGRRPPHSRGKEMSIQLLIMRRVKEETVSVDLSSTRRPHWRYHVAAATLYVSGQKSATRGLCTYIAATTLHRYYTPGIGRTVRCPPIPSTCHTHRRSRYVEARKCWQMKLSPLIGLVTFAKEANTTGELITFIDFIVYRNDKFQVIIKDILTWIRAKVCKLWRWFKNGIRMRTPGYSDVFEF